MKKTLLYATPPAKTPFSGPITRNHLSTPALEHPDTQTLKYLNALPSRTAVAPWNETFRVRAYEIDPSGRASIQTLCNYLQEAAGNHAQTFGASVEQLTEQNLTWVLARLHVQVSHYPAWRETIHVETWPSGVDGLYATREFMVYGPGSDLIAKASSAWLMVDFARRRPVRMPAFITGLVPPDRPRPFDDPFPKLEILTQPDHMGSFKVRYSDLDLNEHANNVRYVEWAVETLPLDLIRSHHLASLEIMFRAEATLGDAVSTEAQRITSASAPAFLHRITRPSDSKDLALLKTTWQPW